MSSYLWLAVLMATVTYPFRAVPLLVPQMRRLPRPALTYLQLAGPAILASLAAVGRRCADRGFGSARSFTSASNGLPSRCAWR